MHYHNKPLSVLHITNDFTGSKVYKSLFAELDKLGVKQTIYTAIRDPEKIGNNEIAFNCKDSKVIYSHILNKYIDRLAYPIKILKIFKDLQSRVDLNSIDYIHAHTWYSDGGIAYLLSKKYNIPFIITVRNTDINIFHKRLLYLRPYGKLISDSAQAIILPSKSYENRLVNDRSFRKIIRHVQKKLQVIPNGVDKFWLENSIKKRKKTLKDCINILFVGKLDRNKQIVNLIESIIKINDSSSYKVKLHIVGSGGNDEKKVLKLADKYSSYTELYGAIYDKDKLLSIYRMCDIFAMPSCHETFGLVYIEALLQDLPILYTHNEGVDGLYSQNIGEKVKAHNKSEIAKKLLKMIANLDTYSISEQELKKNHDWHEIALKTVKLYNRSNHNVN